MAERIRHFSLFYKGKKAATFNSHTKSIESGDEAQFGDEGYLGHADGATTSSLDSDCVVPVKGTSLTILADMLSKAYVTIGVGIVDGKILTTEMRITKAEYTSNAQNGTLMGKFRFEGGAPKVTG